MAEEQAPASTSNVDEDEFAWVADEPRTTVSKFSLNGGDGMFRTVQSPPLDDWKACIPNTSRRICSKFQWGYFPMYQIVFEHMGYRLPFSNFEVAVFRYLHLTPSQVHPNSLAFIRAFETTAVYLGFLPTIPLFFHAFHLQRSKPKGDAANKFGWVSLKQSVKLFEMFLESVRGFKDSYFFVKPLNFVAWQSVIYQGRTKDATGASLVGPDGRPVMEDYSCFPLSWRKSHYLKPASDFACSSEELTVEELSNYEQLKVFVSGFPHKYYEDEEGNPILDEMGVPVTKKAFIDTKKLLACKNAVEMEACFQEMSTIAAKLRERGPRCLSSPLLEDSLLGEWRALPPRATASPFLGGDRLFLRGGLGNLDLDRERRFSAITTSIGAPCGIVNGSSCTGISCCCGGGMWCSGGTSSGVTCVCAALLSSVTETSRPSWCEGFRGPFSPTNLWLFPPVIGREWDFYSSGVRRFAGRSVQIYPEGGCVPADTPTLKSVEVK
ncbi:hypothetical protein TSUD_365350 [Trifolium subterraneum]|uniref:Transposase (putative) gypsy type domain-containing protein n=1 Tax=Trifolium subterraneum TaxID=3900 RepID=A0A2Z6MYQ5_TRISU|nr:hypothetical protein TSUD_365350 [Trifolium subterraneum]